jgi:hypothetical protein
MKVAYHTEWLRHRQEVVKQAFKDVQERGLSVSVYELAFQMLDNYFCNLYDPIDVTKQYILLCAHIAMHSASRLLQVSNISVKLV